MSGRTCDIAIAGGGLAGGLIALALAQERPDLSVRLVESGDMPGGNHRWSWFASDLSAEGEALLHPIRKTQWDAGNEVVFPGHRRRLATPYCSMASADFAAALERELAPGTIILRQQVAGLDAGGMTLADGSRITARAVIDARGFAPSPHLSGGWQVFMGRHLRTHEPHGVERPVIMDASVDQLGGYRFVYVLPLGAHELFVEDTYYQDTPELDRAALSHRIDLYCRQHGWEGELLGFETGVLPVITGGDPARHLEPLRIPGVALVGARGLFTHPLTSYTLPFAVKAALAVTAEADLPGDQLAARIDAMARRHWAATGFYRLLGSMLFGAALPHRRAGIFERFYRLPEPLVERFYAARSTFADKARILIGKPPVPVMRAMRALVTKRPSLDLTQESDPR
ncbi:lycopene beta-cyclase CrtY [Altererythrobacter sp. KTW20L]|uniref:lycopene beta-cyclase CrtY n=1 Tax=Altererythrobacter sp. KTW20L TaxID=2942210 RepID=UPI0020BF094A|nr:lycopene beta-cyclase CrtY [Altererythrobacter sp. KTW20L]MCL6250487.1 lycopene beta-cyclase CrtY [Altererythrobacter sp. KTW20L]